jgi:sulfur carrier protein
MIYLNGARHDDHTAQTVTAVFALLDLPAEARGVAVAVDGEVVPRANWSTFAIPEGARVEVLTATQGG